MPLAATHRRFAIGLVVALAIGLGAQVAIFGHLRSSEAETGAERSTIVAVQALARLLEQAGSVAVQTPTAEAGEVAAEGGEAAVVASAGNRERQIVARFATALPDVRSLRVLDFATTSLVASTAPADRGAAAAPRRLSRDEKPLYDQGQRLRSSVETNRQEGAGRKDEIEVAASADGGLAVAAPVERADEVVGSVVAETAPLPAAPWPGLLWPLGLLAGAAIVFLLVARIAGTRPLTLALLSGALLVGALVTHAWQGFATFRADRLATAEAVGERAAAVAGIARAVAAEVGLEAGALDPAGWDVDRARRPYGELTAAGDVDRAAVADKAGRTLSRLADVMAWIVGLTLVVLLFVGLGVATRLAGILRDNRQAYLYIAPAILAMLLLVFYPFVYGITLSFTDANPVYNAGKSLAEIWVGLDNYIDVLSDIHVVKETPEGLAYNYQNFYWTLGFTIVWTISNVAFGVTLGLFLALILNIKGLFIRPIYRVLLILPWAVPNYITALIWRGMFHRQFGVLNQIVQIFGGHPISWWESPLTSFLAVLSTNGWLSFPFMMVISLGALQSIPGELYEAARVDGASRWQQFGSITLPSLKPALVPAIILSVIWTFNMFNIIYLTSQGEPGHATEILITQAYKIAFEQYRYGYAAAYATVIFLILLVYGIWQNRVTRATEAIG